MITGHIMVDIDGLSLTSAEKEILSHPKVGGVLLFSRNYESKHQLSDLIEDIRRFAPNSLIAVDQEGGRVQRFKKDFLPLPSFREYGELYVKNPSQALEYAEKMAYLMASELKEIGVDLSFTPVLDVDTGRSEVIGDRSFHSEIKVIIALARAFIKGMHKAGMPATGKHFPGHGSVVADSHATLPVDSRCYEEILNHCMQPFIALNEELDAVMPAHILYEKIDADPTCFSNFWLQDILRTQLKFRGVIFSDDLSMGGAAFISDYVLRAQRALAAGCDMILICNNREEAIKVIDRLDYPTNSASRHRLEQLKSLAYDVN